MDMISEGPRIADMSLSDLSALIETKTARVELLEEALTEAAEKGRVPLNEAGNMAQLQLAIDDMGWQPLSGWGGTALDMPITSLQKISDLARALVTANPLVKRGVAIRAGYIWGQGVDIDIRGNTRGRPSSRPPVLSPSVRRAIGTSLSQLELERTAAADGNMFFLCDPAAKTVVRVPIQQITGKVTADGNAEEITYFQRTWNDAVVDLSTGAPIVDEPTQVWYPSSTLEGTPLTSIEQVEVDRRKRIVHVPFNRMVGQSWGIPDIFAVVWWTKAYKEYLEDCRTLSKAYSQYAWKVTSASGRGTARAAAQMAAVPSRDPMTGQPLTVGNSVALGAGQDLQAVNRSSNVDYNGGIALAAMVAAGLEVPLPALTSDPSNGNRATAETLDDPTKLAMLARQRMMADAFDEIFRVLRIEAHVEWPDIAPDSQHRRVQAADMAGRSGAFNREEQRELLKDAMGGKWKDLDDTVPTREQLPYVIQSEGQNPAQIDPPSRGDHELRDEGTQAHTQ